MPLTTFVLAIALVTVAALLFVVAAVSVWAVGHSKREGRRPLPPWWYEGRHDE